MNDVRHSPETIGRFSKEKVTTETTTHRSQNRHDQKGKMSTRSQVHAFVRSSYLSTHSLY